MNQTDEELMGRFCAGEDDTLGELYRRYRRPLMVAMRSAGASSEAEDVVQETFLRVHRARDTFQRGQPVRPWLWTIAHNVRKDLARRSTRRPEVQLEAPTVATASDLTLRPVELAEKRSLLVQAIHKLTPILREAAVSHWLAECDFDEIARTSGESAGTIRVRAHRACVRLREMLMPDLQAA